MHLCALEIKAELLKQNNEFLLEAYFQSMAWTQVLETLELCVFSCLTVSVRTFFIIDLTEINYYTKEAAFVPLYLGVRYNYSAQSGLIVMW